MNYKNIVIPLVFILLIIPGEIKGQELRVYFNGEVVKFSSSPLEKNGRLFVPLKDILNNIGGSLSWDAPSQNIILRCGHKEIRFRTGFKQVKINGQWFPLSIPAIRIKDEIFIPLRFLEEIFGAYINWEKANKCVYIDYRDFEELSRDFVLIHNALMPLSAGEKFVATLEASPGGKALMNITGKPIYNLTNIPMLEKSRGLYEGIYHVKKGDILRGGELVVKFSDGQGNKVSIKAHNPVYINTLGPVIKKFFPADGEVVHQDITVIYILFDLKKGSLIDRDSISFSLSDRDLTGDTVITKDMICYKVKSLLNLGENSVTLRGSDKSGNKFEKTWNFWVLRKNKL